MKNLIFVFVALMIGSAQASDEMTCYGIYDVAESNCKEILCEEAISQTGTCFEDGDLAEGVGMCTYELLPEMISQYISDNNRILNCDDYL